MRYYTSTSGEMVLQAGITGSDTTITVDTTAGLPGSYPYTLILDYGTASEEFVDVTAAASTTLTVTRGRDGSVAQAHAFGAKIRHGITARDLRESREHEAATDAHGVGEVVGTTETQTLDNKTFEPDADHVAVVVRTRSGNTEPVVELRDHTDAPFARWHDSLLELIGGGSTFMSVRSGGAVSLFKRILSLRVGDDHNAITGDVTGSPTGRFIRLMSGATELFYVSARGVVRAACGVFVSDPGSLDPPLTIDVTGRSLLFDGDLFRAKDRLGATVTTIDKSGNVIAPNVTALDGRVDTLEAANADTRLDAIEANLGSQTTFAATSSTKDATRIHWGAATVTPNATGYATVTHGAGFTPTVVVATSTWVNTAVDPDTITATTFQVRILNTAADAAPGATKMTFFCGE